MANPSRRIPGPATRPLIGAAMLAAALAAATPDTARALDCARDEVAYRIDWSGHAAHERGLTGRPSAVIARGTGAIPLVIGLSYGGDWQRLEFDNPRVSGDMDGAMVISQRLTKPREAVAIRFHFPVPVRAFRVSVPDLAATTGFQGRQSDHVTLDAHPQARARVILHGLDADRTRARLRAEERDTRRAGRLPVSLAPVRTSEIAPEPFFRQTAVLTAEATPLESLTLAFSARTDRPRPLIGQTLTLHDARLCAPNPDGHLTPTPQGPTP